MFKHVRVPRRLNQEADEKLWSEIRELYEVSVAKDYFRSVMIDTGDLIYELLRRAKLGTLDFGDVPRSQYSIVNSSMNWVYNHAKDMRVNLCVTHKVKAEFINKVNERTGKTMGVESGKMKRAGWAEADFAAQMVVRMFKDVGAVGADRYKCEIVKCTGNSDVEGEILTGDEITFQNLGVLSAPWSKPNEWGGIVP